jgi:hypothetical protein
LHFTKIPYAPGSHLLTVTAVCKGQDGCLYRIDHNLHLELRPRRRGDATWVLVQIQFDGRMGMVQLKPDDAGSIGTA